MLDGHRKVAFNPHEIIDYFEYSKTSCWKAKDNLFLPLFKDSCNEGTIENCHERRLSIMEWIEYFEDIASSQSNNGSTLLVENHVLSREASTLDCFANKGEYIKVLLLGAKFRNIYSNLLLPQASSPPEFQNGFLEWIDEQIRGFLKVWAESLVLIPVPRPNNLGVLASFGCLMGFYNDWVDSTLIQLAVPHADSIITMGFCNNLIAVVEQIADGIISSISRTREQFFLTRDKELFAKSFGTVVDDAGRRLRKQQCCFRVNKQSISTCSILSPLSEEGFHKFVDYLESCGDFLLTPSSGKQQVVYTSKTLVENPQLRKMFDYADCDRSFCLGDDFVISLSQSDDGSHHHSSEKGVVDKEFPRRIIRVESRNAWRKDKWVAELCTKFDLKVINHGTSNNIFLNRWITRSQYLFEVISMCMLWATKIFEDEDMLDVRPDLSLKVFNYGCVFTLETIATCQDNGTKLTPVLWALVSKNCARWIRATVYLWSREHVKNLPTLLLPALNFMNRMINSCPTMDWIDFPVLTTALKAVPDLLSDKCQSFEESEHFRFVEQFVKRCIERCNYFESIRLQHPPPPHDNGLVEPPTLVEGLKLPISIGRGTFGNVYKCFDLALNSAIALKEVHTGGKHSPEVSLREEINCLKHLNHRHIVDFYGAVVTPNALYLKMELCEGGSLLDLIKSNVVLSDAIFRRLALQIVLGLAFLHGNQVVHGDLKPSNILIDRFDTIKLVDFGAAYSLGTGGSQKCKALSLGTIEYMAPEVIKGTQGNLSADIWSVGCTLFHLATGVAPWHPHENHWPIMMAVTNGKLFDLNPLHNCQLDPRAIEMILSCLAFDPLKRPPISALVLNGYFYETA